MSHRTQSLVFLASIYASSAFALASTQPPASPDASLDSQVSALFQQQEKTSYLLTSPALQGQPYEIQTQLNKVPTYTYLRCYYQPQTNPQYPAYTTYVWAKNPDGSSYKIHGYWWSAFRLKNIFFTDTSQDDLHNVCQQTLLLNGLNKKPYLGFFAANSAASLDSPIWSNDKPSPSSQINKLIVFGDSLSDNGNIFNTLQWVLPNQWSWAHGHFTNGNVWPEYVARELNLPMYDWAIGDGQLDPASLFPLNFEMLSYESYTSAAKNYNPGNALFIFWAGANDIIASEASSVSPVPAAISQEKSDIERLIRDGAKHLLVFTLPDVSLAPNFLDSPNRAILYQRINEFNQGVSKEIIFDLSTKYQGKVSLSLMHLDDLYLRMIQNPSSFGLSDVTTPCITNLGTYGYMQKHSLNSNCQNPNTVLSWDGLHPTTHVHRLLAGYVAKFIQANFQLASPSPLNSVGRASEGADKK